LSPADLPTKHTTFSQRQVYVSFSTRRRTRIIQLHFNLICVKEEHPLPFEKWICRNGQQVRVEDRRIGVAMTLTEEQRSQV
jgi:hypothetical protein